MVFFAARLFASTTRRARPPARGSAEEDAEVYHTNETKKKSVSLTVHTARVDAVTRLVVITHPDGPPERVRLVHRKTLLARTLRRIAHPPPRRHPDAPTTPRARRNASIKFPSNKFYPLASPSTSRARVPTPGRWLARARPSPVVDGWTSGRARRPAMTRRARMRTSNRERPTCRYFLRTLVRRTARRPV